jgi:hypothetical protein
MGIFGSLSTLTLLPVLNTNPQGVVLSFLGGTTIALIVGLYFLLFSKPRYEPSQHELSFTPTTTTGV